jgi:undecaprenyl-diphosphatase
MSVLEALLLGVVQGLTEFLPISSSGHLILVPWLQDYTFLQQHDAFNRTFDVALHVGTLVAVIAYFRVELAAMVVAFFRTLRRRRIAPGDERLAWVVILGTIPAVIVGGLAGGFIDDHLAEPWLIGINLIVFGIVLYVADRRPQRRRVDDVTIGQGIWIGVAQALALVPGVSRSGITISAGRFLGLDRDSAARVSFLLLVPATAGAAALKGYETIEKGVPNGVVGPVIVGMIAAAISGYLAIAGLLAFVRHRSYDVFVVYRVVVGILVLLLIATGVREATF